MKTKSTRLQYIDIAKGIAMICIILGHLGNASINRIVFTFHVPIFFFITGYFTNKKRDLNGFIKNKAKTLLVPYIITSKVIIIIGTLKGVWWKMLLMNFKTGVMQLYMEQVIHIQSHSGYRELVQYGFCGQLSGEVFS